MPPMLPALGLGVLPAPPGRKVLVAESLEGIPAGLALPQAWREKQKPRRILRPASDLGGRTFASKRGRTAGAAMNWMPPPTLLRSVPMEGGWQCLVGRRKKRVVFLEVALPLRSLEAIGCLLNPDGSSFSAPLADPWPASPWAW